MEKAIILLSYALGDLGPPLLRIKKIGSVGLASKKGGKDKTPSMSSVLLHTR